MSEEHPPLFPIGQVLCTPSAWREIQCYKVDITALLKRHELCDCDAMTKEDKDSYDFVITHNCPIISSYRIAEHTLDEYLLYTKVWIITAEDRKTTMVLLPEEYDTLYSD